MTDHLRAPVHGATSAALAPAEAGRPVLTYRVAGAGGVPDVRVWDGPSDKGEDDWLVEVRQGRTRIAVLDGVTPWRASPPSGFNAARWAAGVTRAALRCTESLSEALGAAHEVLFNPALPSARQACSCCVAAADLRWEGRQVHATGVVAGDCQIWARTGGRWSLIAGQDFLLPQWRRRLRRWQEQHPEATVEQRQAAERQVVDDPDRWVSTCVGRFAELRLTRFEITGDAVVLASDGAELTGDAFDDLDRWVTEKVRAGRDDVTVLAIGA